MPCSLPSRSLRAFAMSLSGKFDRADDLVQTTLLRAMANIHSFTPGTNMSAWLFTILRNQFRSEYRKRRREVEDADGVYLAALKSSPEQYSRLEFKEVFAALAKLPLEQREALLLVGASGFSYETAAGICGIAVGTIKVVSFAHASCSRSCSISTVRTSSARNHRPEAGTGRLRVRSSGQESRFIRNGLCPWSKEAAALPIRKAAATIQLYRPLSIGTVPPSTPFITWPTRGTPLPGHPL